MKQHNKLAARPKDMKDHRTMSYAHHQQKANSIHMKSAIAEINSLIRRKDFASAGNLLVEKANLLPSLLYEQKKNELNKIHVNLSDRFKLRNENLLGVLYDISDIINFLLSGVKSVTGIQRLVIATLSQLSEEERLCGRLISLHGYEQLGAIEIEWLIFDLIVQFISEDISHEDFYDSFQEAVASSQAFSDLSFFSASTLFVMGACWIVPGFPSGHLEISVKHNLKIITILYDLIPYTNPHFVPADGSSEFYFYLHSILSISDKIITISRYVADELLRLESSFKQRFIRFPEVIGIPLASQIPFAVEVKDQISKDIALSEHGINASFVLCVGSIEIRKNHIRSFVCWRNLQMQLGDDCPQLVVVGKQGWKADDFIQSLSASNNLNGKIVVLNHVGDALLIRLYKDCLFTIYPSLDEGWGLPIGESLDAGKVCVTSNTASMPEVGLDLAVYSNPNDPLDLYEKCLRLIQGPVYRETIENRIAAAKPLRSWGDYFNDISAALSAPKSHANQSVRNIIINDGFSAGFYWHLNYDLSSKQMALVSSKRTLDALVNSRLCMDSNVLQFDNDFSISKDKDFRFSGYLNLMDIAPSEFDGFSVEILVHYFHPDLSNSSVRASLHSPQTCIGSINEFDALAMKPALVNINQSNHDLLAINAVFSFSEASGANFIDPESIDLNSGKHFLPLAAKLTGFELGIFYGGKDGYNFAIQEVLVRIVPKN